MLKRIQQNLITYGNGGDITRFSGDGETTPNNVVARLGQMMHSLDNSVDAVSPVAFLSVISDV